MIAEARQPLRGDPLQEDIANVAELQRDDQLKELSSIKKAVNKLAFVVTVDTIVIAAILLFKR